MKINKRDKYLVIGTACFVVITLVVLFVIMPFFENRKRLQQGIIARENGIRELNMLRAEYQSYQQGSQSLKQIIAARDKGFTLFSFLEKEAGSAAVKSNIKYMKPSVLSGKGPYREAQVEMKLEGISLKQFTEYMQKIESTENVVNIKRISVQPDRKNAGFLDVVMQVITYRE